MKALHRRLQRLERRAEALSASRLDALLEDEALAAWCSGGCIGPWPPAGPCPAKCPSEEEWQQHHRFLLALCCRGSGSPDPPGLTVEECRHVEDTLAFFASIDPQGRLTLPGQARLAPYLRIIEQFLNGADGGNAVEDAKPKPTPASPTGPPRFQV